MSKKSLGQIFRATVLLFGVAAVTVTAVIGIYYLIVTFVLASQVPSLNQEIELQQENIQDMKDEIKLLKRKFEELQEGQDQNREDITANKAGITSNGIEIDDVSYEGVETHINEIWDELDYLRKKVD